MPKAKSNLIKKIFIFCAISFAFFLLFFFIFKSPPRNLVFEKPKKIFLDDNGFIYEVSTQADNVEDFLKEKEIALDQNDLLYLEKDRPLQTGARIKIDRSQEITIKVDGQEIKKITLAKQVLLVLAENQIVLSRLDKVTPSLMTPPREKEPIIVTRINEEEKIIQEDIKFKTTTKKDSKLGWREEKVEQKGEKGILEVKYKITYQNGKEISRIALEKNITKESIPEIITQGTHVDFGKTHTGLGTWYAQPSGIQKAYPSLTGYYAANPWLEKGSYVKVTNKANGKSIIAVINDRGPFGEGRIIDLDKKAFSEIASLGAGVIDVKVEEINN